MGPKFNIFPFQKKDPAVVAAGNPPPPVKHNPCAAFNEVEFDVPDRQDNNLLFEVQVVVFLRQSPGMQVRVSDSSTVGNDHGTILATHLHSGRRGASGHDDKDRNVQLRGMIRDSHGEVAI